MPTTDTSTGSADSRLTTHFLPRKGDKYEAGYAGHKLLILGESHYEDAETGDEYDTDQLTTDVLNRHIAGTAHSDVLRFFTKIEHLVAGTELPPDGRQGFWDSVLFYNYVQSMLPNDGSGRFARLWHDSRDAFVSVLRDHKPDRVLVLGKTTWDRFSPGKPIFKSEPGRTPDLRDWTLLDSGERMTATWVRHPMARGGFNMETWQPRVGDLLA